MRHDRNRGFYAEAHEVACENAAEAIALLQVCWHGARTQHILAPTSARARPSRNTFAFVAFVEVCLSLIGGSFCNARPAAGTSTSGRQLRIAGLIGRTPSSSCGSRGRLAAVSAPACCTHRC